MLVRSKISASALSKEIGKEKGFVRDFIAGRKDSLKIDDVAAIMRELTKRLPAGTTIPLLAPDVFEALETGIPVVGTIQAGAWMEVYALDPAEPELLPLAVDQRFPHARQYALRVVGDSMDLEAPDGSFAVCVDFAESGLQLREGMIVHVERSKHETTETTLKAVSIGPRGEFILMPRSTNPVHAPIKLEGDAATEAQVRGVMLSVFRRSHF